jgi:hypothetical protein
MHRFSNVWRQLACLAVAAAVLSSSWSAQTPIAEIVFGVGWLSFILAIFVVKPTPAASASPH